MGRSKRKKAGESSSEQVPESPRMEVYTVELDKSATGTPSFKPLLSPDKSKKKSDSKGEETKPTAARKRRRSLRSRAQSSSDEDSGKDSQKKVMESPSKKKKSRKKDTPGPASESSSRQQRKSSESDSSSMDDKRSKHKEEKSEHWSYDRDLSRRTHRSVSGEWQVSQSEQKKRRSPRREQVTEREERGKGETEKKMRRSPKGEKVMEREKRGKDRGKKYQQDKEEKGGQDRERSERDRNRGRSPKEQLKAESLKMESSDKVLTGQSSEPQASVESSSSILTPEEEQEWLLKYSKPVSVADQKPPASDETKSATPAEDRHRQGARHEEERRSSSLKDCLFAVNEDHVVVVLPSRTSLVIAGKTSIRCLYGSLNVSGFKISPSRKYFPVYSPDSTTRIAILAEEHEGKIENLKENLEDVLKKLGVKDSSKKDAILATVRPSDSIVILLNLKDSVCDFVVSAGCYRNLFGSYGGFRGSELEEVREIGCGLAISRSNMVQMSREQRKFIKRFCDDITAGKAPVVAFCGGKNVGKSTMARHTINSVLNCCPVVAYLECDIGQTEMTPPGCVAVHIISDPLLGPPFTHQKVPFSMCYVGAASPAVNPAYYMHCVLRVYQRYSAMETKIPLIVNTMGWPKGLGLSLLVDTLRMVKPTYVVQLNGQSRAQNMDPVGSEFVTTARGLDCMKEYFKTQPWVPDPSSHDLHMMDSPVMSSRTDGRYRPVDLRHMALLSHLHKILPPDSADLRLLATPPLILDWSSVAIHSMHETVPWTQIMYALNGSLVALCRADPKHLQSPEDSTLPKYCTFTPACQCLGLGIVRGIDGENKKLLLLSTVPISCIKSVNLLLLGSIELPQPLLMNQPEVNGSIPYVGESKDVLGASSIKPRRHMKRFPIRLDNGKDTHGHQKAS